MSLRQRLNFKEEPVYLIDGNNFFFRGFFAFRDISRSDGFPTNAMFVVLRMLLKLLREEQPKYLAFFLDGKGPGFRSELYPEYKAQRSATPEALVQQIEPLKQGVEKLGIPLIVSDQGAEADDCIASAAAKFRDERPVVILGADKDFNQCLRGNVIIWDPAARSEKVVTPETLAEITPVAPEHWADYQALIGDSSDNIPGIPGVGPKTAVKVMEDFPTLEDIRDRQDELPKAFKKKLDGQLENIFLYRDLTRLRTDLCDTDLDGLTWKEPDWEDVKTFLQEYEFRTLQRELPEKASTKAGKRLKEAGQNSLFEPPEEGKELFVRPADKPWLLPRVQDQVVGLVLKDEEIRLGIGHEELVWIGEVAGLVDALGAAQAVATPDVKTLLHADAAWREVSLDHWFDLSLAAYLLSPEERSYDFARLRSNLGLDPDFGDDPHADAVGLAAKALHAGFATKLGHANLTELMRSLEIPLIPVLADMEASGVAIDRHAFEEFLAEVGKDLERLSAEIHAAAGGPFNIRSSQQLAVLLFETLGLKPKGKTPGGALSTSSDVLEKLKTEHEVVQHILDYRMLEKLRSTYLEPLPKLADDTGRIHTTFNQTAAATGRLSSSGPNLQNIPIRGPQGTRMRACFTSAPGTLLAAADYSQIELRVLAHFSQDPELIAAFTEGTDIHARTAGLIFGVNPEDVHPDDRRAAKAINFGLLYGMGPQKLAQEIGVTMAEAKDFIARYFEKLSRLKAFYDEVLARAEADGHVTTLLGRRRLLPELASQNDNLKAQARRQAVNTVIQGSAADIIKKAMLDVHADAQIRDLGGRLILQIHDELLLEAPENAAQTAGQRMKDIMASVVRLDVPLVVDMGVGKNWAEAH